MQSLLLLSAHRALGHTLAERAPPPSAFSDVTRAARGTDGGDVVDALVEGRVVLEKVRALEGRMRYQIEKLVRAASDANANASAVDDPLAFRPNPANLANDGAASDVSDSGEAHDDGQRMRGERQRDRGDRDGGGDGIYRPPRLAPVPYTAAPLGKAGKRTRAPPVPSALRSLHDPFLPHAESTSGLGGTPAAMGSSRARALARLTEFEEENFGRVVLGKGAGKRRARDEEDLALGAELGAGVRGGGKNRRRGGLEDEFGDVLRSVERGGTRGVAKGGVGVGDGYDELRRGGRKKSVLERSRVRARDGDDDGEPDVEEGTRVRKKSRFEQDTKNAKRRLKKRHST
jgi:U3 small nucleolar ribonucleoprotein protein LCP5